jgi:DNA-binding NtrC family response regulator
MTEQQIKHMIDRFLGWKLPDDFRPDGGVSFRRLNYPAAVASPSGTNLFDATQAEAMVRHMVEGLPEVPVGRTVAELERELIIATLEHCAGNRMRAARMLGISIRTLRIKIRAYNADGAGIAPGQHGGQVPPL